MGIAEELRLGKCMSEQETSESVEGLGQAVLMDQECKGACEGAVGVQAVSSWV